MTTPMLMARVAMMTLGSMFLEYPAACSCCWRAWNTTRRDSWEQVRRNQAELLFVVDNSQSMLDEQAHLGDNFQPMLDGMLAADVTWRISVTTASTLVAKD